jgi:hypothetical protein
MTESTGNHTAAVQVKLQPIDQSDQPVSANYSTVGVAQGIAYLDFGFLEPAHLAEIVKNVQSGNGTAHSLEGALVVRVAMGLDVVQRLQHQLQQVLVGVSRKQAAKA